MLEAFRGESYQKVDSKARVLIPASFRKVLAAADPVTSENPRPRVVMVYGDKRRKFVECYTVPDMQAVEQRIRAMPEGDKWRKVLEVNMITMSLTVEVDEDGRLVLPPKVREKLGLTVDEMKEGVETAFAGMLDKFQIWKRATYDRDIRQVAEDDLDELPEDMDILSLLSGARPGA